MTAKLYNFPIRERDINERMEDLVIQANHIYESSVIMLITAMEIQLKFMGMKKGQLPHTR